MNLKVLFAAAALCASQAFAIAGIGGHYAPNVGTELKTLEKTPVIKAGDKDLVSFSHGSFTSIQGFGFKAWIDCLPFIDIEATFNIQFASYNAALFVRQSDEQETKIPLEIELAGVPFGKATPKYVAMNGDLSITYPFLKWLPIVHPYVGGGITYHLNTFILNKKFVEDVFDGMKEKYKEEKIADLLNDPKALAKELAEEVVDEAMDKGLNKSVGMHFLLGARAKLPIIPIAIYANAKLYLGGDYDSDIDAGHFAFEIGGGLAF